METQSILVGSSTSVEQAEFYRKTYLHVACNIGIYVGRNIIIDNCS